MAAPPVGQGPTLSSGPPLQVGCRDMEALASLVLEAEPTVRDRPQVTCVPPNSPYTLLVRDVARSIGADFVRSATGEPSELYGCVVVADLTLVRAGGKLGSNVIAISHRLDLECYEVITPEQVREFHDVAIAHGGTSIEQPPGPRVGAMGTMHLAYVRDPDGNKLCAMFREK